MSASIHVSIISHLQSQLVSALLADFGRMAGAHDLRISVVSNLPEEPPVVPQALAGIVEHTTNESRAGFGANHNRVFRRCNARFFCVLNPDVRLPRDPFPELLRTLSDERVAVAAPAAYGEDGEIQDNARRLPTPARIAAKLWPARSGPDYANREQPVDADCVAGFFMLFRSSAFRQLGGFDERYFLYYEDIDLCTRARLAGFRNAWVPSVTIVHNARRTSRRHATYFFSHLRSMARFFASPVYRTARKLQPSS